MFTAKVADAYISKRQVKWPRYWIIYMILSRLLRTGELLRIRMTKY